MMLAYLRDRRRPIGLFLGCCAIFFVVFALYRLPLAAVGYGATLCAVVLIPVAIWDFLRWRRLLERLKALEQEVCNTLDNLPAPADRMQEGYQALLRQLFQTMARQEAEQSRRYRDMTEYYTLWAHQIKTPIAAMQLILQSEGIPAGSDLGQGLFEIRQYVEMVLSYLRLDSPTTDFVIQSCDLDRLIRQALRTFGPSFIRKRLRLNYEGVSCTVVTDEKWLLFALEQVLSNAVNYTARGSVSIFLQESQTLVIADTGPGIAPEDLPRIFEKGYTGHMGRADRSSTGIGLYLTRRALTQLGHTIRVESRPGEGTRVLIGLERQELLRE